MNLALTNQFPAEYRAGWVCSALEEEVASERVPGQGDGAVQPVCHLNAYMPFLSTCVQ